MMKGSLCAIEWFHSLYRMWADLQRIWNVADPAKFCMGLRTIQSTGLSLPHENVTRSRSFYEISASDKYGTSKSKTNGLGN